MSLNNSPKGERIHIALFGKRNAGKSSLINAITDQSLAIVSPVKGTTTDPVYKAMELLPLGPVVIIDTPGLDDDGQLGQQRVQKTMDVLNKTDIALIVIDAALGFSDFERELLQTIQEKKLPSIIAINKADYYQGDIFALQKDIATQTATTTLILSAITKEGVHQLKESIGKLIPDDQGQLPLVRDLLQPNDVVVLVVPIDSAAPKGRLILPQQQTIRDILEAGAISVVTRESELPQTLASLANKPRLVITDSQAFAQVSMDTPADVPLTSFSILFARYKGDLDTLVNGVEAMSQLKDGDTILISEGCTHHRQCDDIGTVKLPKWLLETTGKQLTFEYSSGTGFPKDLQPYAMVVHCGGCTLNRREMQHRIFLAKSQNIPIMNYGVLIAHMKGILPRTIAPFATSQS